MEGLPAQDFSSNFRRHTGSTTPSTITNQVHAATRDKVAVLVEGRAPSVAWECLAVENCVNGKHSHERILFVRPSTVGHTYTGAIACGFVLCSGVVVDSCFFVVLNHVSDTSFPWLSLISLGLSCAVVERT